MSIVTVEEVRSISGAPSTLIDDIEVQNIIDLVELKTKDLFGIEFTPTKKIETLTGGYKDKILVDEYFPLTIYKLLNGETEVDFENIYVHEEQGFIELYGDTSGYYGDRFSSHDLDVKLKYLYGIVERDNSKQTDTTSATAAGTNVNVEVLDTSSFTDGDYAWIEDTNRAKEVFKIVTVVDGTNLTAEILTKDYESGAMITVAKTHEIIRQFVLYEAAIAVAVNAVGGTYTIATGYSIEGVNVQVGVPWTHWQNNYNDNVKQRDFFMNRIKSLLNTWV
jgi:hypothetical protein